MNRIDSLIADLCPQGVRFLPIGDPTVSKSILAGATPRSGVTEYWEGGTIPWMSSGEVNKGTVFSTDKRITQAAYDATSTKLIPPHSVVIALAGQGRTRGTVARTRIELCTNQSLASIVVAHTMDSDFLYYFLRTQYRQLRQVSSGDGARGGLTLQMIRAYRVPVPPIEVQREIVRVLDAYSTLEEELAFELARERAARVVQYGLIRNAILNQGASSADYQFVPLSEIADFQNGKAHERLVAEDGTVALMTARFISTGGVANRWVRTEDALTPGLPGDIAMVMSDLPGGRALARCFYIDEPGRYTANQRVCLLRVRDNALISSRWLFHYLNRNPQLLAYDNGQDQTHLKKGQIQGVQVPLLPLELQEEAASKVDLLNVTGSSLLEAIESETTARHQQYEFHREELLTFEESAV